MKSLIPLLIIISFFGLIIGSNIYIAKRLSFFFSLESSKVLIFGLIGFSIFCIASIISLSNASSHLSNFVYNTAAVGIGLLTYVLLSVIVVDIAQLFISVTPRVLGIAAIAMALIITSYGLLNARHLQVIKQDVKMNGLNEEVRVMHLTDIHIGHWHGVKYLRKIVNETNKQNVDAVFITGDLFDGLVRLKDENLVPLQHLNAPVYFVDGNHDKHTGSDNIKTKLRKAGVTVLENELAELNGIQIIGLDHMAADHKKFDMHASPNNITISDVLPKLNIDKRQPSILLHHSPNGIEYASKEGVDLFLTGHTHAGQLFPYNLFAKLLFPYNEGLHTFENTQIYVSHGAGTFGPPLRVGTRSEITVITLKPE